MTDVTHCSFALTAVTIAVTYCSFTLNSVTYCSFTFHQVPLETWEIVNVIEALDKTEEGNINYR